MRLIIVLLLICVQSFGQSHYSNTYHNRRSNANQIWDPNIPVGGTYLNNGLSYVTPLVTLNDGNLSVPWNPNYAVYYPNEVVYELDGSYNVSKIVVYDNNPGTTYTIKSGNVFDSLQTEATLTLNANGAQTVNVNKHISFLSFSMPSGSGPTEIKVFGTVDSLFTVPPLTYRPVRTFEKFIGWDCNITIPTTLMPWKTSVRHYDYNDKVTYDTSSWIFSPNRQGYSFDDYYKYGRDSGKAVYPLLNDAPNIYQASYTAVGHAWTSEYKNMYYGANPYSKWAWKKEGETAWQMTARYGRKAWSNSFLKINTSFNAPFGNVPKSGLNTLDYVEFNNEIDRWWKYDTNMSFLPKQYFMLASVRYDGHNKSMGPGVGAKVADSSMKVVAPALADFNPAYYRLCYLYGKRYRTDKSVPWDVYNYHWYENTGGGQFSSNSIGICPELATRKDMPGVVGIQGIVAKATEHNRRYTPTKEIVYSELGYDCSSASYCGTPILTQAQALAAAFPQNAYDLQASLLVRSAIEIQNSKAVDNIIFYETFDEIWYKDIPDDYSDVHNNPAAFYDQSYGGSSFATSGITKGEYAYVLATGAGTLTFGSTTGNFTFALDSRRVPFTWSLTDTLDLIDENNYGNRFKAMVTGQSQTSLSVHIYRSQGSGSISSFVVQTPYAKKPAWYAFNNCIKTFGDCFLVADSSHSNYRDYVYRNQSNTKEVRVIWKPTQDGSQLNSVQINYPNTHAVTQRLFLSTTGATSAVTTSSGHFTTNINEQPKIFYYSIP